MNKNAKAIMHAEAHMRVDLSVQLMVARSDLDYLVRGAVYITPGKKHKSTGKDKMDLHNDKIAEAKGKFKVIQEIASKLQWSIEKLSDPELAWPHNDEEDFEGLQDFHRRRIADITGVRTFL